MAVAAADQHALVVAAQVVPGHGDQVGPVRDVEQPVVALLRRPNTSRSSVRGAPVVEFVLWSIQTRRAPRRPMLS
jgi:hypothetical protein